MVVVFDDGDGEFNGVEVFGRGGTLEVVVFCSFVPDVRILIRTRFFGSGFTFVLASGFGTVVGRRDG